MSFDRETRRAKRIHVADGGGSGEACQAPTGCSRRRRHEELIVIDDFEPYPCDDAVQVTFVTESTVQLALMGGSLLDGKARRQRPLHVLVTYGIRSDTKRIDIYLCSIVLK